jgi:hypothetical protein
MSWQNILPKIAIVLPLMLILNEGLFENFYITSVVLLFILIKVIARAQLIFSDRIGIALIVLILAFLFIHPFLAFLLAAVLHIMIVASILGKL